MMDEFERFHNNLFNTYLQNAVWLTKHAIRGTRKCRMNWLHNTNEWPAWAET